MKKNRADLARGWTRKAESDIAAALRTIESAGPYDTACFHCQQAAEKYLKAFLAWYEQPIPKTHDIEELVFLSSKIQPLLENFDFPAEELSAYAVEMRYDEDFWPDIETAKNALREVEKLWKKLKEFLPDNFKSLTFPLQKP
ncbi:MAG: HEPN domain-containing protein [Deltaproteobacteria bacterium]|nr:HEPN domain-containing protein [Deltaproteobacteria bacterium]